MTIKRVLSALKMTPKSNNSLNNGISPGASERTEIKMSDFKDSSDDSSNPIEFTDIVGGNGPWQNWIFFFTTMVCVPLAWNHMGISFLAFEQDYWCARPNGNESLSDWWTTSITNLTEGMFSHHNRCRMYVDTDFPGNQTSTRRMTVCKEWEYDSTYKSSIISQWDLVCEDSWMVSMSQSVYMSGILTTTIISGQLADLYGRLPVILTNTFIIIIAGISTAFSTSFVMFTVLRFFVSMGFAGLGLTAFVLLVEVVGASHRAVYGLLQGLGWSIGFVTLPLLAWLVQDWFYLQLIIILPCLSFLSFYWVLCESPRWLLSHGKVEKAIKVMERAAKGNRKEVKDLEIQAKKLCCIAEEEIELKGKANVLDLLRTPNLRKTTLCLYFSWIVIALVYYGLSLSVGDLGGNFYLNFFLSGVVEFPATFICVYVLQNYGRRKPFMISQVSGGIACIACIFIPESIFWFKVTLAMIGKLFVSSSFNTVFVFSAELFPTVVRNVGVGSSSTCARIGSIIAPFMKELGKFTHPSAPMAIFGVLSILSGLLSLILPETSGNPVPETLQQAEDLGKKEKVILEKSRL